MFLIVNCLAKEAYQQPFEPTEAQRADDNLMCFGTSEVTIDKEKQIVFEQSVDSLTGWDELPLAECYPPQWEIR